MAVVEAEGLTAMTHAAIRQMALDYAKETRHHPFRRVSQQFVLDIERLARLAATQAIKNRVDCAPSKGVTLK